MEFSREPRLPAPTMVQGDVTVDPPPEVPKPLPGNLLARLLPVAMLVAAGGMMALYFTSGGASASRGPMFMFFPVMMIASVLGSLAYSTRGANQNAQLNEDRRDYLGYLDDLDRTTAGAAADQHRSLHWSHPDPATLWTLIGGQRMWERALDDPDFGQVRVGLGEHPLSTRLAAPEPGLDPVTASAVSRLIRRRSVVADVPVVVSLRAVSAVVCDGDPTLARALLRAMLCQLAVLHSPEHLRIAVVTGAMFVDWDWLKWLPHHQHPFLVDALGPARMTYRSLADATAACGNDDATSPHVVVVVDDGRAPVLEQPLVDGPRLQLALDGDTRPDGLTQPQASVCARRLAPYRDVGVARHSSITGWLELMGLTDPHSIEPARQWRPSADRQRLRVPIGVTEAGDTVMLDIKEAAQNGMGPHGLCVGATGSGKSEFLRTLVLGMIAAHPPDVVNLVLVDFKGGATFLGLDRVRHVSAIITNLSDEAHLVARMQDALAGEMNRRQELLRAAGLFANVADYERARRQGNAMPPLPALFIVVDEFSELLSQHPEFAELFVAIGRLGRSLGMHLLLASQRLDEGRLRGLETHLSYRICLKTFSASESRAVLGVSDAYHLPTSPGAAYLKTPDSELVRFQTAFVSAPYENPRVGEGSVPPSTPRLFTAAAVGPITQPARPPEGAGAQTLMDTVLTRLAGHGTAAHRVWLPPLTQSPVLDDLIACGSCERPLSVPIGIIDSPYDQRRDLLITDLSGAAGNVAIVGAPQTGKSTTVRTLVTALAAAHDPTVAQFYCLDFGGGELVALRDLPHVGSVAARSDADLCRRVVAEMESIVRSREAGAQRTGDVFLVIDGWATLRHDFEALESRVVALAAQGLSYGVHVVVTASRWAEIRPALKDQLGTRIELRLGDPADSEMDRKRARQLGLIPRGRGITRDGKEMVIAWPRVGEDRIMRWGGRRAHPIELLPLHVPHDATGAKVVLGVGECELQPVVLDFADQPHLLVLGETESGKTSTLRLLCREIVRTNIADAAQIEIVDFRRSLLGVVESAHLGGYSMSATTLAARVSRLVEQLEARLPSETVTQQQLRDRSWWSGPEIYLVVDDYDLVATATGNPLTPLADYLPHAKDVGLHVIVARRSGGAARAMFDPVLARLRELGCTGLMMSASAEDGVLLGSVRPTRQPPGRGTLVTRGQPDQLVQVAWTDPP